MLVALLSGALLASQQPVPRKIDHSNAKKYEDAQRHAGATNALEVGTPSHPLTITIPTTPEQRTEAAEAKQDRKSSATRDNLLIGLTGALAVATFWLGWITRNLWKETAKAVGDTEEQLKLTKGQLELARDEFRVAHRAKVFIRSPWIVESFRKGEEVTVEFLAGNRGDNPARLLAVYFFVVTSEGRAEEVHRTRLEYPVGDITILPGIDVSCKGIIEKSFGEWMLKQRLPITVLDHGVDVPDSSVRITIHYDDGSGRVRQTSVHRRISINGDVSKIEGSEYEFEH